LTVVATTVWVALPNQQDGPTYQGVPLSKWISKYADLNGTEDPDITHALLAIGPDAFPCLLKWMSYETPAWREKLRQSLPNRLKRSRFVARLTYGNAVGRAGEALVAFDAFGTNAAPAIPALVALSQTSEKPSAAMRALLALGYIGEPAIPALTNALANPLQLERHWIPHALEQVMRDSTNTRSICVSVLLQAMHDPDIDVRGEALTILRVVAQKELLAANITIPPEVLTNAPPE
jgi:HEAT repeat protein